MFTCIILFCTFVNKLAQKSKSFENIICIASMQCFDMTYTYIMLFVIYFYILHVVSMVFNLQLQYLPVNV